IIAEGTQPRINTDQHGFKNRLSRNALIRVYLCSFLVKLFLLFACAVGAADTELQIVRERDSFGFLKPVPVNISGFTGEVESVLKQDLIFMGVVNAPIEE